MKYIKCSHTFVPAIGIKIERPRQPSNNYNPQEFLDSYNIVRADGSYFTDVSENFLTDVEELEIVQPFQPEQALYHSTRIESPSLVGLLGSKPVEVTIKF